MNDYECRYFWDATMESIIMDKIIEENNIFFENLMWI